MFEVSLMYFRMRPLRVWRGCCLSAQLAFCFACLLVGAEEDTPYDTSQDWISGIAAQGATGCSIASPPVYQSPPRCPATEGTLTAEDYQLLGYLLAPKVYMHPDDWSFLADPKAWLENTTFYDTDFQPYDFAGMVQQFLADPFVFSLVKGPLWVASRIFGGDFSRKVSTASLKQTVVGDPIVNGQSTAKVWFTASNPARNAAQTAVVFTWHYYYPFNGCSNELLAVNIEGKYQGAEYYLCSEGVHEGDWERVTAYTCLADLLPLLNNAQLQKNASSVIRRMQYAQHNWWPEYDCSKGQCPTELGPDGITRPVSFSGLFSHASYATASPLHVYSKVDIGGLLRNIDGVYIGDRTTSDGPVFQPTPNNTVYLPPVTNITAAYDAGLSWAMYPGGWGGAFVTSVEDSVTCFFDNLTSQGICNATNPAYWFLNNALKVVTKMVDDVDKVQWIADLTQIKLGQQFTGPLMRNYSYTYAVEAAALLVNSSDSSGDYPTCPFSGDPTLTDSNSSTYDLNGGTTLGGFVGTLTGLLIGAGVLFSVILFFPGIGNESPVMTGSATANKYLAPQPHASDELGTRSSEDAIMAAPGVLPSMGRSHESPAAPSGLPASRFKTAGPVSEAMDKSDSMESGNLREALKENSNIELVQPGQAAPFRDQPVGHTADQAIAVFFSDRHMIWLLLAVAIYIAGLVLTCIGISDMFKALAKMEDNKLWGTLQAAFVVVVVLFGVWQLVTLVLIIVTRSHDEVVMGGRMRCHNLCSRWRHVDRCGYVSQVLIIGLIVIEINTTVIIFALGFMMWVVRYLIRLGCTAVFQKLFAVSRNILADVCLNLEAIGLPQVNFCGQDLVQVCTLWDGLQVEYLVYGSYLFILSHLMFLAITVNNSAQLRMRLQAKQAATAAVATTAAAAADARTRRSLEG